MSLIYPPSPGPPNVTVESGQIEAPLADPNQGSLQLELPIDPDGNPFTFHLDFIQTGGGQDVGTVLLNGAAVVLGTQALTFADMQNLHYLAPITGEAWVELVSLVFSFTNGTDSGYTSVFVNIAPAANGTFTGTDGADRFDGGAGNDTYVVNNSGDVVLEQASAGTDTVTTALGAYALGANVENLTHTGSASFVGVGNDLNNVLVGGTGNDYLVGGLGNDTLIDGNGLNTLQGGAGDDIYAVQSNDDTVFEFADEGTDQVQTFLSFYRLSPNVENLTFIGNSDHSGVGNDLSNVLTSNGGNDTLDGGVNIAGFDTLVGGLGNDTYVVNNVGDVTTEAFNAGTDTVKVASLSAWTLAANVENLTYTGNSDFTGTGNALNNVFTTGTGVETLIGGAGNDTYIVNNTADVTTEVSNGGTDTVVISTLAGWALAANVENLTHDGSNAFIGQGNDDANVLIGGTGNDTLYGYGGNDTLIDGNGLNTLQGGTGDDIYAIQSNNDTVFEFANEGTDQVQTFLTTYVLSANVEQLVFVGAFSHSGTGNELANTFTGSSASDTFTGAGGNDLFNFRVSGNGLDTVTDFNADNANAAEHDHIDLRGRGLDFGSLAITSGSGGVMIGIPGGDGVFLKNVAIDSIDAGDFFF